MASVYTNDLRLEEIGSGEQSGTWGDTTNTNLELIAEAFSFGTEAITTNADTHTTTIADGATDPGRSMFLKYTGTLDSACTITIAPNTVSKLWFIENGTSGSQNILISQGSGANITIPPGDTKAIYSDGAGSGAAMVDAFASLSVVDLKVQDDLTVTDDVAIGGLATVGGTLAVTGVVTANAGVVVDEMTLDADTLTATDTFTIDAAGDITLDADGADIRLSDAGTQFGKFTNSSSDFVISSSVNDKDIKFAGADGGADITALTLDMSDAGTAIFNHDAKFPDNAYLQMGAGSDLSINSDGTNGRIFADNGNLTFDVASTITLDADGGYIWFNDGGTTIAYFQNESTDLSINVHNQDRDIFFKGNDGGAAITALTLDMSENGATNFRGDMLIGQGKVAATSTVGSLGIHGGLTGGATPGRIQIFGKSTDNTGATYEIARIEGKSTSASYSLSGGITFLTAVNDGSNNLTLAEKVRILDTGGITFNGDTATANALNDYEEGTWTPVITTSGAPNTAFTQYNDGAFYTKVGNQVFLSGMFRTNGVTIAGASGHVIVTGLPFASSNANSGGVNINSSGGWTASPHAGYTSSSQIQLTYQLLSSSQDIVSLPYTALATGSGLKNLIHIFGTYRTDS